MEGARFLAAASDVLTHVRVLSGGLAPPKIIGVEQPALVAAAVAAGVPAALAWAWAARAESAFVEAMKDGS